MPTTTVTPLAAEAPRMDTDYRFTIGDGKYVGVVRAIRPLRTAKTGIGRIGCATYRYFDRLGDI